MKASEVYLCSICGFEDLPSPSDKPLTSRSLRSKGEKVSTNWVECSSCKLWSHPTCNGVDVNYLSGDFRCIPCCLELAVANSDQKSIAAVFKSSVKRRLTSVKQPSSRVKTSISAKKNSSKSTESVDPVQSNIPCKESAKAEKSIQVLETSQAVNEKTDQVLESNNIYKESKQSDITKIVESFLPGEQSTKSAATEKSNEVLEEPKTVTSNILQDLTSANSSNLNSPCSEKGGRLSVDIKDCEDPRSKIVVIDNIPDQTFWCSKQILREVNRFCSPRIKVLQAYSLARGGVAIHLESTEERDRLLSALPPASFLGGTKKKLSPQKETTLYLGDIDQSIQPSLLQKSLVSAGLVVFSIERVISRKFGRPSRFVKLVTDSGSAESLLASGLLINGVECSVAAKHSNPVIRCYGCQRFGHIISNCLSPVRCEQCGGPHYNVNCAAGALCVNCGSEHPSSYESCPEYIKRYERLTSEHTINQHIQTSTSGCCRATQH